MPIRRLPDHLVNQIAAGEVVERPAAALKELVENALDAGARRIAVTLGEGGLAHIAVEDDGCGMSAAELRLAVERHATSKLPTDDALGHIATLGFRGEALPSIASVARLAITSRVADADGWRLVIDHGVVVADGPAAGAPGTRVTVDGLFERVPARRKFLKSARAEYAACLDTVRRLALAAPSVAFSVDHDGRRTLDATARDDGDAAARTARVGDVLGRDFAINCAPVAHVRDTLALAGLAGLPTFNHATPGHQYLFVNGRPVRDRALIGAVRGAYTDLLARARHPAVALFVSVPADAVDVNVHPAKTEVRFADPAAVRALIVGGVRRALDAWSGASATTVAAAAIGRFHAPRFATAGAGRAAAIVAEARMAFAGAIPAATPESSPPPVIAAREAMPPLGRARAQLHGMWIVAETADGLILVDQHAAHERVMLERLNGARLGATPPSQPLLLPEIVELDEPAADRVEAAAADLAAFGLDVDRFGPAAVVVRALPAALGQADAGAIVRDLAAELLEWGAAPGLKERLDGVAATLACHASVRAGRALSVAEMDALLRQMEATPHAGQCNHGRPTYVRLAKCDIEKLFGRR